jgi:hypothetical protein
MLRAGIWKPRTRPNAFEGVGEKGLPWLNLASKTTGLPVCVEVASPEHVELALKYEVVLSTKSVFEILSLSIDFFSFLRVSIKTQCLSLSHFFFTFFIAKKVTKNLVLSKAF